MWHRHVSLLLAALALASFMSQPIVADDKPHEGTVVSAGEGKLTMTMKGDDKKHTHDVAKDAKITINGKPAKLADFKEGFHVKVTMDKHLVTSIAAHAKEK